MTGERDTEAMTTGGKTEAEPYDEQEAEELGDDEDDSYLYDGIYGLDPDLYRYPY